MAALLLDKSAQLLLKKYKFSKEGEFRTVYGNDETVFEALVIIFQLSL